MMTCFCITRRRHEGRAELEAEVLREMKEQGAPVTAVIARDRKLIVQEHSGEMRLSEAIDAARWSAASDLSAPLSPWFAKITKRVQHL